MTDAGQPDWADMEAARLIPAAVMFGVPDEDELKRLRGIAASSLREAEKRADDRQRATIAALEKKIEPLEYAVDYFHDWMQIEERRGEDAEQSLADERAAHQVACDERNKAEAKVAALEKERDQWKAMAEAEHALGLRLSAALAESAQPEETQRRG